MNLKKPYKNSEMEARRLDALRKQYAASLLQERKKRVISIPETFSCIRNTKLGMEFDKYETPLNNLAKFSKMWIRPLSEWRPKSHNTDRQFGSLARHLLCKYKVPTFMDGVWRENSVRQQWFIDIGSGQNIRKSAHLPIPLTKKQAMHFLEAPSSSNTNEAFRYAQVLGLGGTPRLAAEINNSILRSFYGADEEFWETVIHWFIQQGMFDYNQIAPMLDYINVHRPLQPNFTMHGRTVDSLIRQMEYWHGVLQKSRSGKNLIWGSCPIQPFYRVEGAMEGKQKIFEIKELLSSAELQVEGRAMNHCVYSYAGSCYARRIAIFSLTTNKERGVTIEVNLGTKAIVQVRGKHQRKATAVEHRIISAWATQEKLRVGGM